MLFELPDDNVLYQALLDRDTAFDGRAWVGVTSTGIFCRLTCAARKPRRENSLFFDSVAACLDAGFRPCRRCRPLGQAVETEPAVQALLDALERDPQRRWRETDVVALGHDPSTVRRAFRRHFGITFLEMARLRRVRHGAASLSRGARVVDAQLDAGFDSASGFRAALAGILGRSPAELAADSHTRQHLVASWIDTPLGAMISVADAHALRLLEFFDRKGLPTELKQLQARYGALRVGLCEVGEHIASQLHDYFAGRRHVFDVATNQAGSDFTREVWQELARIPCGQTRSYGELAARLGRPAASRAVARANGANQLAILVPCHRVIGADGSLTGYGGGRWRKRWLLDHERKIAAAQPHDR